MGRIGDGQIFANGVILGQTHASYLTKLKQQQLMKTVCSSSRPRRQARRDALTAKRLDKMADHNANQARAEKGKKRNKKS